MKLYDEIMEKTIELAAACGGHAASAADMPWQLTSERNMVLRSEMAYELGLDLNQGLGATILTDNADLVPQNEIIVCGKDLNEIDKDMPYARIALVRVEDDRMGTGNALYNAIRKLEYVRYHFYPEGFMMRISASKNKESVRVSKEALKGGITFGKVGSAMIKAFEQQEAVRAVKLIYITNPAFDYPALKALLTQSEAITETMDHMLKDLKMDCDVCNLKPVCDEVEGLRELHFEGMKPES